MPAEYNQRRWDIPSEEGKKRKNANDKTSSGTGYWLVMQQLRHNAFSILASVLMTTSGLRDRTHNGDIWKFIIRALVFAGYLLVENRSGSICDTLMETCGCAIAAEEKNPSFGGYIMRVIYHDFTTTFACSCTCPRETRRIGPGYK